VFFVFMLAALLDGFERTVASEAGFLGGAAHLLAERYPALASGVYVCERAAAGNLDENRAVAAVLRLFLRLDRIRGAHPGFLPWQPPQLKTSTVLAPR
jgi:hypothetical protein